jgi:hypothetical protein
MVVGKIEARNTIWAWTFQIKTDGLSGDPRR